MDKQGFKDILKGPWVLEYSPLQKCFHIQPVQQMLNYNQRKFYSQDPREPDEFIPLYIAPTVEEIDCIAEERTSCLREIMGDDIVKKLKFEKGTVKEDQ